MWSSSAYSSLAVGISAAGTAGTTTATTDIQSHMEKYLTDGDSVTELDGDSDGNSNGEVNDSTQFNNQSRSRGLGGSSSISRPTMTSASAHHHVMIECKTESDVLDLHKDDGCSGASGLSSGNKDSARDIAGRWTPLTSHSPPSSHHGRHSPSHPHHHHHQQQQQLQPMDISSPVLQRSGIGASGSSSAAFLQQRHGRPLSNEPLLDRFRSGIDRFQPVSTGLNHHQPVSDLSLMAPGRGQSDVGDGHGHGSSGLKSGNNRGVKSYHCRMCEQEFANKSDMQRHAKEAHRMEDKGHKCMQCLKSFPSSQQLAQHSLVHSNVRKYSCSYCDKAFKQLSHVQQHQRIHTGERPYRCPVDGCTKAFRQLSSLQQHLKGHNIPLPKSYPVSRAIPAPPAAVPVRSPPTSESPPSCNESSSKGNRVNSGLARPHDLTCQVCEKHCADEVRFFCHIHKYHPDYWRVFSGGRPLSDFIETNSNSSPSPTDSEHHHRLIVDSQQQQQQQQQQQPPLPQPDTSPLHREKRFACTICDKRFSNETGFVKHMAAHSGFNATVASGGGQAAVSTAAAAVAAVDDLLANGNGRMGGGWLTSGDGSRVSLFNCPVCSKLFTKEAYLLRHMEMKLDPGHAAGLDELKKSSGMFRLKTVVTTPVSAGGNVVGLVRPPPTYHDGDSTGGFLSPGGSSGGGCLEPTSMISGRCDRDIGYRIRKMLRPDSMDDEDCVEDVDERAMSPLPPSNYVDRVDPRRTPNIGLGGGHPTSMDLAMSARRQFQNQLSRSVSCVSPLSSSSSTSPPSPPASFTPYLGNNSHHSDNRHHHNSAGGSSSSSYSGTGPSVTSAADSAALLQRYQPLPMSSEFLRRCNSVDGRLKLHRPTGYHVTGSGLPMQSPSSGSHIHSPRTSVDMDDGGHDGRGGRVSSSPEMDDTPSLQCPPVRYLPDNLNDHHQIHRRSTPTEFYSPPSPYIRFRSALDVPTSSRVGMVSPGLVGVGHGPPGASFGYPQYYGPSHLNENYLRRATGAGGSGDLLDRESLHSFR